jgi:hypothetical protein
VTVCRLLPAMPSALGIAGLGMATGSGELSLFEWEPMKEEPLESRFERATLGAAYDDRREAAWIAKGVTSSFEFHRDVKDSHGESNVASEVRICPEVVEGSPSTA